MLDGGIVDLDETFGGGGDLGVLLSTHVTDTASLYSGGRVALVGYPSGDGAFAESVTVPLGISIGVARDVKLIVEGGLVLGWEQFNGNLGNDTSSNAIVGGYGTFAIQLTFGGEKGNP